MIDYSGLAMLTTSVASVAVAVTAVAAETRPKPPPPRQLRDAGRLIVTAHPDDRTWLLHHLRLAGLNLPDPPHGLPGSRHRPRDTGSGIELVPAADMPDGWTPPRMGLGSSPGE